MLPKKFRITLDKDIKRVLTTGRSFFTRFLNFKIIKNDLEYSRFCIIVSGKVDKRTVVQNRIKRQIREILRLNLDKIKHGYDVAIIVKGSIMDKKVKKINVDYREVEKNIIWAFGKMGIQTKNNKKS